MGKEVKTGGPCDENCFGVLIVIGEDLEGCSYMRNFLSLVNEYPFPIPDSTHESREISRIEKIIVSRIFSGKPDNISLIGMLSKHLLYEGRFADLTWSYDHQYFSLKEI